MNRERPFHTDASPPTDRSIGVRRAGRADPGPLRGMVLRRSRPPTRGPTRPALRRVPLRAPHIADPVLLPDLPMEVPWALLLGRGPYLRHASGPVHVRGVPITPSGARTRGRSHRRDRTRWSRAGVLEPADDLPTVPPFEDPSVPHIGRPPRRAERRRGPRSVVEMQAKNGRHLGFDGGVVPIRWFAPVGVRLLSSDCSRHRQQGSEEGASVSGHARAGPDVRALASPSMRYGFAVAGWMRASSNASQSRMGGSTSICQSRAFNSPRCWRSCSTTW